MISQTNLLHIFEMLEIRLVASQIILYNIMNRQYCSLFRTKTLHHQRLKQKILQKFKEQPCDSLMNFDQILFLLDQASQSQKSNRDIAQELFSQTQNRQYKAKLSEIISTYIENIQTSKLCILRDQAKLEKLEDQVSKLQSRSKSFIFLKIIQISIYSRFNKIPILEYQILPTDIPPVKLVNSLNPMLNHEFLLEMEEDYFDLAFYESGIQIFRWTFPDVPFLPEGEYQKIVQSENVSFQAKIKYLPKGKGNREDQLNKQISQLKNQIKQQHQALQKLCQYQPFLQIDKGQRSSAKVEGKAQNGSFTRQNMLNLHVKTNYWLLIILVLLESQASAFWSIQFLDIIACIYLIGLLSDLNVQNLSMQILILQISFALLTIKSIWGAVQQPRFSKSSANRVLIVICIIFKLILILMLNITRVRQNEIEQQRKLYILGQKQQNIQKPVARPKLQADIWDD